MKLGTIDISKIYLGSTEVTSGYLGTASIYSSGPAPLDPTEPFYFYNNSNTNGNIGFKSSYYEPSAKTVYYSTDRTNWSTTTTSKTVSIPIPAKTKVYFKISDGLATNTNTYWYFKTTDLTDCTVGGNIMSLFYGTSFTGSETSIPNNVNGGYLQNALRDIKTLTDASNLLLPATTLRNNCYNSLFSGCSSLTTAPVTLPATTLESNCYNSMFTNCTSLSTPPELPTTTLATQCYNGMFQGCSSLTTAPDLPATTLVNYCYSNMFNGCSSLNYIKCLATVITASGCRYNWVNGVANSGTFVKDASMNDWPTGTSGIPTGWTIQNA